MRSDQDDLQPRALREVQWRIGRNLLAYQHIEHKLKIILPYIHPKGSNEGIDAWRELRKILRTKKSITFGILRDHLKESVKISGSPGAISAMKKEFKRIVDDRNDLAHGLLNFPGISLLREEGCKKMCDLLDNNFSFAQSFNDFVNQLVMGLRDAQELASKSTDGPSH